jgi:2-(1,2-epoxy-1,2-dihydrophenyl)acetyl-CoA isomerase
MDRPRVKGSVTMNTDGWLGVEVSRPATGVLLVTLNRPERLNALTVAMKRDLIELFTQAQADDETRVLVLTGAGRAFCAGDYVHRDYVRERPESVAFIEGGHADAASTYTALKLYSQALNRSLRAIDKPTIAALNGVAIQSGLSLALACDFRLAATTARLGSGTLRFGLMPDEGGHYLLLQHLGLAGTIDFLLRKRIFDAPDAMARGLVNEVVSADELVPATLALASELAAGPQLAQRMLKRAVYRAAESNFDGALDDIAVRTAITDHHPDATEGARAFAEKRPPKFA